MSWLLDEACHEIMVLLENMIDIREEYKREQKARAESKVNPKMFQMMTKSPQMTCRSMKFPQ